MKETVGGDFNKKWKEKHSKIYIRNETATHFNIFPFNVMTSVNLVLSWLPESKNVFLLFLLFLKSEKITETD